MQIDSIFILMAVILFFAAFTQGLTGFGFALVSIPLLSFFIDIKAAIPLAALYGLVLNIYLILKLKAHIRLRNVTSLIIGSAVGIPIGALFVAEADPSLLKTILAFIIIFFVIFSLTNMIKQAGLNKNWGYLFGLASGLLGGAFNTNGPPILIYFYLQGWDKFKQKASITGFFIVTSVMIVATHIATGLTTSFVFNKFLYLLPVVVIGMISGHALFSKVSQKLYNRILLFGLLVISVLLLIN